MPKSLRKRMFGCTFVHAYFMYGLCPGWRRSILKSYVAIAWSWASSSICTTAQWIIMFTFALKFRAVFPFAFVFWQRRVMLQWGFPWPLWCTWHKEEYNFAWMLNVFLQCTKFIALCLVLLVIVLFWLLSKDFFIALAVLYFYLFYVNINSKFKVDKLAWPGQLFNNFLGAREWARSAEVFNVLGVCRNPFQISLVRWQQPK